MLVLLFRLGVLPLALIIRRWISFVVRHSYLSIWLVIQMS
jgi:hypothetical protein